MTPLHVTYTLPSWLEHYMQASNGGESIEQKMRFVIEASKLNIEHKTGGPFAAAIFDCKSHQLISLGVNVVTSQNCSILHAEMCAIMLAQKRLETFDLSSKGDYELVTTTEPCAMCFGAIPWSGIKRVVSGASDSDARAVGFDEGEKVESWKDALEKRGIEVIDFILQEQANKVLQYYKKSNGIIY